MNIVEYTKMAQLENNHFWFLGKRFFIDTILYSYKKHIKNILDLGSGTGGMTKFLGKFGKVIGIEKNKLAISLSKKSGVNVIHGNIQNLKLGSKKFDLVTILDVLYHKNINNIPSILKNTNNHLNPNGLVLITDSALDSLKSSHDEAVHGARRFVLKDLEKMLVDNNFSILKQSYVYFSIFPMVFIKRFILNKITTNKSSDVKKVPYMVNLFILKLLFLESVALKYISFPIGSSILILAQKKES